MDKALRKRVLSDVEKIEAYKGDDDVLTYHRYAPHVRDMIEAIEAKPMEDRSTCLFAEKAYIYAAEAYTAMGRFALSGDCRMKALRLARRAKDEFHARIGGMQNKLTCLLRDRNYYVDDDCEDVRPLMKGLLLKAKVERIFQARFAHRRSLKHDPVEASEAYLAVIDEVEEKIAKNRTMKGLGSCHEIWHLKFVYLMEKGIEWQSPSMLNPHVMFD